MENFHQDSWKEGRSAEVISFVEKVEARIWPLPGEEQALTDFQRGYWAGEVSRIKSGGWPPSFDIKNFDETFKLINMFLIDCPP